MAEHGVGFVELFDSARHDLRIAADLVRELLLLLGIVRDKLMQRRIDEPNGDRKAVHGFEDSDKVSLLEWPQLGEGFATSVRIVGDDHFLDRQLPLGALLWMLEILEEHVLGS